MWEYSVDSKFLQISVTIPVTVFMEKKKKNPGDISKKLSINVYK